MVFMIENIISFLAPQSHRISDFSAGDVIVFSQRVDPENPFDIKMEQRIIENYRETLCNIYQTLAIEP